MVKAMVQITFAVGADPSVPHEFGQVIEMIMDLVLMIISIIALVSFVAEEKKKAHPRAGHSLIPIQATPTAWIVGAVPPSLHGR
jgi:hypothetical protein